MRLYLLLPAGAALLAPSTALAHTGGATHTHTGEPGFLVAMVAFAAVGALVAALRRVVRA